MLSRDQILAAGDIKTEDVEVPEWGGTVRVRTLSAADRLRVVGTAGAGIDTRIIWLVAALVDDKGGPLMKAEDVAAMMQKSAKATDRVYEVVSRLNFSEKPAAKEAAKN